MDGIAKGGRTLPGSDRIPVRVACVTGVSRGLGPALAAELLARGFEVVGFGRSADVSLRGPGFRLAMIDLADVNALGGLAATTFAAVAARAPVQAVLINNAAVVEPVGVLGTLDAAGIARSFAVNLIAPAILANAFVASLTGRTQARIVNVSSGLAVQPLPGVALYCAAKAGLEMLTAVAAVEASPGIAAVSVRPGIIDTPMQATIRAQPAEVLPPVAVFVDFHASGRLQTPADTARFIVERCVVADVPNGATLSYAP